MIARNGKRSPRNLYDAFAQYAGRFRERSDSEHRGAFRRMIEARDGLFDALDLPRTSHNCKRLFESAEMGDCFEQWFSDIDRYFPRAIVDDERLFLGALSSYFSRRGVTGWRARLYDVEAFLNAVHHPHNVGAIDAWLSGHLTYVDMCSQISADGEFLMAAVC